MSSAIKERPILMTGDLVRATLDRRKTQTRRIPGPTNSLVDGRGVSAAAWEQYVFDWDTAIVDPGPSPAGNAGPYLKALDIGTGTTHRIYCRIQTGDRLWVRETWQLFDRLETMVSEPGRCGFRPTGDILPEGIGYKADLDHCGQVPVAGVLRTPKGLWRPSIYMPRWASRILLGVQEIRVERVQDIEHEDALAEGINPDAPYNNYATGSIYRDTFAELWDRINAKRGYGWKVNPWVWVVVYKLLEVKT